MTDYLHRLISETYLRQKRFSRKEKDAFLAFLEAELDKLGLIHHRTIIPGMMKHVHLEAGSEDPDVILLAHYDTQTLVPFWVEWLIRLVGHTRTLLFLVTFYALTLLYSLLGDTAAAQIVEAIFVGSIFQMLIPNRHTMNDNTSGVIALLSIGSRLNLDPALKGRVKLIFTDNEERMLSGSFALKRKWNREGFDYRNRKIISVDSVGRGNIPVISYNLNSPLAHDLKETFTGSLSDTKAVNMWITPFSDAYGFSLGGAVNINMMEHSLIPGGFFIRNIHSPFDTKISAGNIKMVADAVCRYVSVASAERAAREGTYSNAHQAPV